MKIIAVGLLLLGFALAEAQTQNVDWDEMPRDLQSAKRRFDKAREKAANTYLKAIAQAEEARDATQARARKAFITVLDAEIKTALGNEDLDGAMAMQKIREMLANADAGAASSREDIRRILVGTWKSTNSSYRWTFKANGDATRASSSGSYTRTGKWSISDTHVDIVWDRTIYGTLIKYWDSFRLPLDVAGTTVDSYNKPNSATVTKVDGSAQ